MGEVEVDRRRGGRVRGGRSLEVDMSRGGRVRGGRLYQVDRSLPGRILPLRSRPRQEKRW